MAQRSQTQQPLPDHPTGVIAERFVNASQPLPSLRVLVVDDNPINRKLLKLLLEAEGHSIVEADNGISALERLDREPLDAVISDILMPEMDGYRLCHEIRKSPKFNRIPFIVYTASYTLPADEKLALQFGVDRFIRKPAADNEIVNGLNEVLASAAQRDQKAFEQPEEADVMREYSQALVRKLEQTVADLSDANRNLAERTALAEFVAAVSTAISQRASLKEMLRLCCDAMVEHLDSAFARIWTLNEKEQVLELQASSGLYTHINGGHARIPVGQFKIGLIASEVKPHLTNTVIGDPRVNDQEWAKREGMIAFAGYPLKIADQLVGVMATFARKPFSQNTLDAMGSVAQNIAVGIQRQFSEAKLRSSDERFRELAENINEIFFIAGPGGNPMHYISPGYEQITGEKVAELYKNPYAWLEMIHPDDRPRIEQAMREDRAGLEQEYRILRSDGTLRWLRSRSFPVKGEHGEVARVVGIATDITEQKQAEAKVNQNLDRIRALHEINLAITSSLDLPTVLDVLLKKMDAFFPYPTVSTVRLLNRTTGELDALACHNIEIEDWKNSFVDGRGGRAYKVLADKVPLHVRKVLTHSDTASPTLFQKYGLVSYIGLPLIAKDQALGVLNFYTKKEHEFSPEEIEFLTTLASQAAIAIHNAQLHEQTQRQLVSIRAILDTALDCIVTMDGEGKIIEFNPAAEKTFDYTRGEVVGKELAELMIPPSLRERHRRGLAHYLTTGDGPVIGKRIELTAMRADGTEFPIELIISRTSLEGRPTFTGFIRDISERKRAEEQTQRNLERIRALHEIDLAITSSLDLPTVLKVLLEKMEVFFSYPTVTTVRLLDRNTGELEALACHNIDKTDWQKSFSGAPGLRARRVLETKVPLIVRNVAIDRETASFPFYRNNGLVSYVGLPLVVRDEALGVLNVYTREEWEFGAEEVEFLMTLAGQAAIAIHNAQLHEQTQQHLKRIEGVSEINNAIASTLSLKNVIDILLEKIELISPFAVACGVRLFDQETGKMIPLAALHIPFEEWRQEVASARGRLTQLLMETKRPVAILNMHNDSRTSLQNFARRHGLVSYLGVPLIVRDKFIGNLVIYTKQEHAFRAEEIEFFTNLGSQAAIAIHNARLYEETERRRREAEELARVARSFTETLDVTVVGGRIVSSMRELFSVQGAILRLSQADGSLRRLASSGEVYSQTSVGDAVPSGAGLTSRALTEGRPVWSTDILNDPEIILTDEMREYQLRVGNRSMIAVPLRAHEKTIGALTLSDRTGRTYSDNEGALLQTFADQAALALENARLYEQTERQLKRLEALREIEKSITSTLDLSTVLNVLMEKIDLFFTYPAAATVRLFDKRAGLLEPAAARNIEITEWITAMRDVQPNEKSYGRVVVEQQEPVIIANLQTDSRTQNPDFYREHGLVSYAGVPLIAKDEVLGVLGIYTKQEHSFSKEEIELLMVLGWQAAIAIHNARLYEETLRSRHELETTNQSLERSLRQLDGLHTALAPIGALRSIAEMIGEFIDRLIDATGADAALIRTWDENKRAYRVVGQRGFSDDYGERSGDAAGGAIEWVIAHGEPIITPDIASDSQLKGELQLQLGFRSCAILPLRIHDEVRGVIHVSSRTLGYFDNEQTDHLTAIARQMSIAMENRELFTSLKSSRDELERTNKALIESNRMLSGLHTVGAATSQTLDIDKILQAAIEKITEIFGFDATQIHIYDPKVDELLLRASCETEPAHFTAAKSFKKGQGIVGQVAASGEALIFEDLQTDLRYKQLSRSKTSGQFGYHFFAVLPIKGRRETFGTLACVGNEARNLNATETQMLEAITGQIAIALENSTLYQNVREKVDELQQVNSVLQDTNRMLSALHAIAAAASQSLDVDPVLQAAIDKITEIFGFDATRIHLMDDVSKQLLCRASYEKNPDRPAALKPFNLGEGVVGRVAASGQAMVFEDIQADSRYRELSRRTDALQSMDRFVAVFPVRSTSGIIGTLACRGHDARRLSVAEVQLLEAISDQVAVAIENGRLFEKNELSKLELEKTNRFLDKSLNQLSGLYTAITPLGVSESVSEMMSGIVNRLIDATGADAGSIRLWDKNSTDYPVIGQMGYSQEFIDEARPQRSAGAVGWVITHGEPIIASNIASDTRLRRKAQLELGFKSCAILPLHVHGEVSGVIQISSRKSGYFDEEQKDHLLAVAGQISIALENRELFDNLQASRNELERANKVKDEFLSVMSHELRTPLSVVIGYSGMLREEQLGPLTTDQEQALEIIRRNSQELFAMIDSIMDATKIEAGSMVAEMDMVSPAQLLADIKLSYDFPNRKNICFEWNFSEALPPLWTDLRKLRQILTNLVNNAIKFTDEGKIVISAEENFENETGGLSRWMEFRIADSGIGIPPEEREKIFERFHQVDGSGTRSFEGVGLGLYIVKSFSAMLGGQVSVESVVGKGSSFIVKLPLQFAPSGSITLSSLPLN